MPVFQVEFYVATNGSIPVEEFLDGLPVDLRVKAARSLLFLQEKGNLLREPYSKPIQDGLFELRVKFASDIARVFYFFFVGQTIIVTNGFVKKTPKTPPGEIKKALVFKKEYEGRQRP